MRKEKFYITTAIAYASQKPHIGNTYEVILTDAIARFKKMAGYDVFFLTGTDEHGQKIEEYAKKSGVSPKEYVDKVSGEIKRIWKLVGADFDKFIRTTDDYHEKAVANIFKKLYDKGDIYKSEYEGLYCVPCESFFTETQAPDGICPDCGRPLKKTKEETYFFRMSKYQDRLMKHIEEHPDFIVPESRKKEMINNFLKPGLQDLCVSRSSFKWGIPVSFDDKHVIYVWIDALSNYITALGYDVDEQGELYKKYWPADVHIIGKDILRFHTIYWPIILMALGQPLPKQVFGHPWLNFGADKMSKSKGNVLYADDLVNIFGVDGIRYYVLSEMPYANDGSITYETIIEKYNTDLANNLGNLVSRTIAMTQKYFDGVVPEQGEKTQEDRNLAETAENAFNKMFEKMTEYRCSEALDEIFKLFKRANKYIDETTPWILAKDEKTFSRLGSVIYNLLEAIRFGAVMLKPFIPKTAEKILRALNTGKVEFETLSCFGQLEKGITVNKTESLFARLDGEKLLKELKKEQNAEREEKEKGISNAEKETKNASKKAEDTGIAKIGIDDFMKVDLRTALIYDCEPVPKADKLLKIQVDLGYEKRQIVSGIAKFYKPEELIGKKIIIVSNLAPAKLRGVDSNGMLLASGEEDVKVVFLSDDTPLGQRVR